MPDIKIDQSTLDHVSNLVEGVTRRLESDSLFSSISHGNLGSQAVGFALDAFSAVWSKKRLEIVDSCRVFEDAVRRVGSDFDRADADLHSEMPSGNVS